MSDRSDRVVRVERTFDAPAEAVYDAWTSPEVMRRWFHVGPAWTTPEVEVDPRVGGRFRVMMRGEDGREAVLAGEYMEMDRPNRLVMTCVFSDDPSRTEQLIELSFSEANRSTTVVLTNSRIPNDERYESQRWGWGACFDELETALASG